MGKSKKKKLVSVMLRDYRVELPASDDAETSNEIRERLIQGGNPASEKRVAQMLRELNVLGKLHTRKEFRQCIDGVPRKIAVYWVEE